MKTCPLCGRQNPDDNKFCNYCGTALSAEADPNKDPEVVEVKAEDKPAPEPAQPQNDAESTSAPKAEPVSDKGDWTSADTFAIVSIACAAEALPVVGIVFGYLGLKSKRLSGLAKAGLILSIVVTTIWAIYLITAIALGISKIYNA
jgi:hypothetical protein